MSTFSLEVGLTSAPCVAQTLAGTTNNLLADRALVERVLMALLAGLVPFVLLFNWGGGIDTDPPTCLGMFGYPVPCGGWPSLAAGPVTAGVIWRVLWLSDGGS